MQDGAPNWFDPDVATFGDRVAAARDGAGLTQEALAKRLGVKLSTIQKWENDLAEPRANRLSMMAGVMGVSVTWLINGTGEGVDAEDPDATAGSGDLAQVLTDLRALRADLSARAEYVGRLEKRVRRMLDEAADG